MLGSNPFENWVADSFSALCIVFFFPLAMIIIGSAIDSIARKIRGLD